MNVKGFASILLIAVALCGCSTLTLENKYSGRMDAIGIALDKELLRNILRARDGLPPRFSAFVNIVEQQKAAIDSGSLALKWGSDPGETLTLPSFSADIGPTFTIQPLASKEFYTGIVSSVDVDLYNHLVYQGVNPEVVIQLFVQRVDVISSSGERRCLVFEGGASTSCMDLAEITRRIELECGEDILCPTDLTLNEESSEEIIVECLDEEKLSLLSGAELSTVVDLIDEDAQLAWREDAGCWTLLRPVRNWAWRVDREKIESVFSEGSKDQLSLSQGATFLVTLSSPEGALQRLGAASRKEANGVLVLEWATGKLCDSVSESLKTTYEGQVHCLVADAARGGKPGHKVLTAIRLLNLSIRLQQSAKELVPSTQLQLVR